jgi:hypothetical protein
MCNLPAFCHLMRGMPLFYRAHNGYIIHFVQQWVCFEVHLPVSGCSSVFGRWRVFAYHIYRTLTGHSQDTQQDTYIYTYNRPTRRTLTAALHVSTRTSVRPDYGQAHLVTLVGHSQMHTAAQDAKQVRSGVTAHRPHVGLVPRPLQVHSYIHTRTSVRPDYGHTTGHSKCTTRTPKNTHTISTLSAR